MSYSVKNFRKVREMLAQRRDDALSLSRARYDELHGKFEDIRGIDAELAKTGMKIFGEINAGSGGIDERIDAVRKENEELTARRAVLLKKHGYPADYTDVKYTCALCGDTGYRGIKMCDCMKKELTLACIESSGIGALLDSQSFENFNLNYYRGEEKKRMESNMQRCIEYAEHFGEGCENLLFIGDTGLGKTHLSTSIASAVIGGGFDVVYDTAQNIFSVFEAEKFGRSRENDNERYMRCDLLIMDDLGTETTNQFTVSCLYNIMNTRLINNRATIINTNLNRADLSRRYTDRIASRLLGEYTVLMFVGKDIRMQKLGLD